MSTMYQVSTLQALAQGHYDGVTTIGELLKKGDIGLGTFQGLNGEMIVLDGKCYRANDKGVVNEVAKTEQTPFAEITFLGNVKSEPLPQHIHLKELLSWLGKKVNKNGRNNIYICRIDGDFSLVKARSEIPQEKPYRTLAKAMITDQREFSFTSLLGSLVCVYFPMYMDKLNLAGWHIHFLSQDKNYGGHVFDLTLEKGDGRFSAIQEFGCLIPKDRDFQNIDFDSITKEEIEGVESASK